MKNNKYLKCCICFSCLYVVQFVIFPVLLPNYYPTSNNAVAIFAATALLASMMAIKFITDQWKHFLVADLLYGVLICCFNWRGMYGIGRIGMNLDGLQSRMSFKAMILTSILIVFLYLSIQMLMILLRKIIKYVFKFS